MKTTTLTTADGREIRVHHAEDWSGQARLRFAPDSNQGDIHLPGWVARGLCRREPQCCADSRANLLARAEQAERERDEARALAEERRDYARAQNAKLSVENDALRSRLAKTDAVVEAARARLVAGCQSACGLYHTGPGSASFSRIFPEDTYPTNEAEADAFVKARMQLWFSTWIAKPMSDALRALEDSGGSGAASNPGEAASAIGDNGPEPAGIYPRAKADSGASGVTPRVGSGTPGPTVGAIPAAGATDPLAALAHVLSMPLTEEDRKRIEGVVAKLRPEPPRGGLLPEPWERRPNLDPSAPATRREVEELRVRVGRLENLVDKL